MQLVSDHAYDLSPEQLAGIQVTLAPLYFTLDGRTYSSGVDIQPDEFYELLSSTESFPVTSQPSAGEFAKIYKELAATDPEILSLHVSSGLSGTLNAAKAGAVMTPEAHVTFIDSLTLSCPMGWQVLAAGRALQAGWQVEQISPLLDRIRATTEGMFTLPTLKYLIHGGRISHLKGLVASLLNIKPVIGVEKVKGMYATLGQEVTLKRAIYKMAELVARFYPLGSALRVQVLHGKNMEGALLLQEKMSTMYPCTFETITTISPVLGAHTGPGLVGMAVGMADVFNDVP
jgi:DegV family protein with EDD domain